MNEKYPISYPLIKKSSMEKIMDNFFIGGCHPWMKKPHPWMTSTDEDDR